MTASLKSVTAQESDGQGHFWNVKPNPVHRMQLILSDQQSTNF